MRVTIGKGTWEALAEVFVQEDEPLCEPIEAAALVRAQRPHPYVANASFTLDLTSKERDLLIAGLPRVEAGASIPIKRELVKLREALST